MRKILFAISCLILFGCTKKNDHVNVSSNDSIQANSIVIDSTLEYEDEFKLENYLISSNEDPSQVQVIDFDCSLSIYPTEEQIEELKKTDGDDFYTIADDNQWYQSLASETLDSIHIDQQSAEKPFIKFVGDKSTWTLNIRKENLPKWNLILFKKNKEPKIVSTIDFTLDSAKAYFDIRE